MPKWVAHLQSFSNFFLTYFTENFIGSISFFSLPCPVLACCEIHGPSASDHLHMNKR